jgi:Flp pilus assembly protein TadD
MDPAGGRGQDWQSLFHLRTEQVQAFAALGRNHYQQGRKRSAEAVFQCLIGFDRASHFGYAGMGALRLSEGKLDEAAGYLRKAAELQPQDPTVRANLGETLLRQAKFKEAAAEFEAALTLDPGELDPGANRARAILQGMKIVLEHIR